MRTLDALSATLAPTYREPAIRSRTARLALAVLSNPADRTLTGLDGEDPEDTLDALWADALETVTSTRRRFLSSALQVTIDATERLGLTVLTPENSEWPAALDDLGSGAPIALWAAGDVQLLNAALRVAIFGGRVATEDGRRRGVDLAIELAAGGWVIVTPADSGTDVEMIDAALHMDGRVVAIADGGLDRARPDQTATHRRIVERGGLVISETPPGVPADRTSNLTRARLMAAAAPCLIVVEAGLHSPAIAAARTATHLGRSVAATPVNDGRPGAGSRQLLDAGADAVTTLDDLVRLSDLHPIAHL